MAHSFFDIRKKDLEGFEYLIPNDLLDGQNLRYIGAIDDDEYTGGILVWHANLGYIQIDHMAVDPSMIGEGIALGMLNYLLEKLKTIEESVPVTAIYTDAPEYEEFDTFIRSNEDFEVVESGRFHIIDGEARRKSEYYQKLKTKSFHTEDFTKISPLVKKKFYFHLEKSGNHLFSQSEEKELIGEMSRCCMRDGEVSAVVLVSVNNMDELDVSLAYCKPEYGADLGMCLTEAIKAADRLYPEKNIVFNAENEHSIKLSYKLFGDNIKDYAVYTAVSFGKVSLN